MHFTLDQAREIVNVLDNITSKPEFLSSIFSLLEGGTEYDNFAKSLLSHADYKGTTMNLLETLIEEEFFVNAATPTSIMRGNTFTSRILGLYCKKVGTDFLTKYIKPFILSIQEEEFDFEMDDSKISDKNVKEKNRIQLFSKVETILEIITSKEFIESFPREIRSLAFEINKLSTEVSPENTLFIIGGFVMLRFINTALFSPEFYDLIPTASISVKFRRNLTLICKVLQNISNRRLFIEEWMLDCNSWMEANLDRLNDFLVNVSNHSYKKSFQSAAVPQNSIQSIDFAAYKFFHNLLTEKKQSIIELFDKLPDGTKSDETTQLIRSYNTVEKPPTLPVDLYYSPLCPFSRSVWLFCLETKIPITLHKIDLLKEDHALDSEYKKFSQITPSLKVPLLVDQNLVLEESFAILNYLADKFIVPSHWLPRENLKLLGKVFETVDWMHENLQIPIFRLWDASKNPSLLSLSYSNFPDIYNALCSLNSIYQLEARNPAVPYFGSGAGPSFVDLLSCLMIYFAQLIQGFSLSQFQYLKHMHDKFINLFSSNWKTINFEFEGYMKYITTVTNYNVSSQITQTVLFKEAPNTVYEMILDPDNDIFLFLASKTISNKTNAKLKRGLKKLNAEGTNNIIEAGGEEKVTLYIVNLDIGGNFNIRGREGTNLLLVPGKKIAQVSRLADWDPSQVSTEIFDLKSTEDGKTLLTFTQMNCPLNKFAVSEEFWNKFWKKMNGVRVTTVEQSIYFKGKTPFQLYSLLTDFAALAKAIKTKVKVENDQFSYPQFKMNGRNKELIINKKITQYWRLSDWPEDHYACVTNEIEAFEGGCRLHFQISNVPFDKANSVKSTWKSNFWKKLNGVVCEEFHQQINFRISPFKVYELFLSSDLMTKALKAKCTSGPEENAVFSTPSFKGNIVQTTLNSRIILKLSHKDWPQHPSFAILNLTPNTAVEDPDKASTKLSLVHMNVPSNSIRSTFDCWTTEFWEKIEGIHTIDITRSTTVNVQPEELYALILNSQKLTNLIEKECQINPVVGGDVFMYDKFLRGKITFLQDNTTIKMSVRDFDWPYGHYSEVIYRFEESDGGSGTLLIFKHNLIPVIKLEECHARWENFVKQLKKLKGKNHK